MAPSFLRNGERPRCLLVSDLDHTMVMNEDSLHAHLLAFNRLWHSCFASDSLLCYSTGRSPELYRKLWEESPLLSPDILICSVGTEVFYLTETTSSTNSSSAATSAAPAAAGGGAGAGQQRCPLGYVADPGWVALLDQGWQREALLVLVAEEFPELVPQAATEMRRHKLSYHLHLPKEAAQQLLARLRERLAEHGLAAKIIYSGGVDVDIISPAAGKGRALQYILGQLAAAGASPTAGVQVNGDSGNDAELLEVPGVKGCVVSNAHSELKEYAAAHVSSGNVFMATRPCAAGIMQALKHFGFLTALGSRGATQAVSQAHDDTAPQLVEPQQAQAQRLAGVFKAAVDCVFDALGGSPAELTTATDDGDGATHGIGGAGRAADTAPANSSDASAGSDAGAGGSMLMWLDELRVSSGTGAGAGAGAGVSGDGGSALPSSYVVECKVYTLEEDGRRNLAVASKCKVAVTAHAYCTDNEGEGASDNLGLEACVVGGEVVSAIAAPLPPV